MRAANKLSQYYRSIIIRGALVALLVGTQFFLWGWVRGAAVHLHENRSQRHQIGDVRQRITQMKEVREQQKDLLGQLDVVVPIAGSLSQIIERLERVAAQHELKITIQEIKEVEPSAEETTPPPVTPVQVAMILVGRPAQILAFMDAVEHAQETNLVKNWSLTTTNLASGPQVSPMPINTLTMNVLFFFQKETDATQ